MSFAGSCQPTVHCLVEENSSGEWGEGSGLYIKQTLITPEDQSLNLIGENCSLRGSSKEAIKGSYKAC